MKNRRQRRQTAQAPPITLPTHLPEGTAEIHFLQTDSNRTSQLKRTPPLRTA